MKKIKLKEKLVPELEAIECDICKEEYTNELEIQEFLCIDLVGGYASIFGDGNNIQCDICQHCMKKLFGDKIRVEMN